MKYLLILLLIPSITFGQRHKGYGQIAFSTFMNKDFGNRYGFNASGGAYAGKRGSIGAGMDFYLFQKQYEKLAQLYADFRFYFMDLEKTANAFLAFQPGAVLYNRTTAAGTTRGSFGVNGMAGFLLRPAKGIGATITAGVSHLTFHTKGTNANTNFTGFKLVAGFVF